MATEIANGTEIRFRRGQTVDTGHVGGGDLRGLRGAVVSAPFKANGVDGPKGQMRVAVAVKDDRAPVNAGLITAPVENLEPLAGRGVVVDGGGSMAKLGIIRVSTVSRGGKRFAKTLYKDGRETYDPID